MKGDNEKMIKVINGKRYNTETATEVHHHSYGFLGDFDYRARTLYLTKKGSWFIYHVGGANTDMAQKVAGNSYSGSEDIEPITEDEAYKFLEKYDAIEAIEKYFPDRIEDA